MPSHRVDYATRRKYSAATPLVKKLAAGLAALAARLDNFCGRMNAGLGAVAAVLAIAVFVTVMFRTPVGDYFLMDLQYTDGAIGPAE
jgi:hypothetical protein